MKILQVNVVYKTGSTGKIVERLHRGLKNDGLQSIVCYGRGKKTEQENVYKVCSEFESNLCHAWSYICGIPDAGQLFSTQKLKRIISREKPDIVHLHCLNGYFVSMYRFLNWLKEKNIKVVLTLHAEFMYTGGCAYALDCQKWRNGENCNSCDKYMQNTGSRLFNRSGRIFSRMKEAFDGFQNNMKIISVSPWLYSRAKSSPILNRFEHSIVLNGIDTAVFRPYNTDEMKESLGFKDKKIIFHPTANFSDKEGHIKGGRYLIELANSLKDENVVFLVAGIHKEGIKVPENIILLGKLENQVELARYYSMADITVITSLKETFSMVVPESLCCGTPVVGFKAGAPEQITIKEYSEFVESGDVEGLSHAVLNWLNREKDDCLPKLASEKYSSETMYKGYKKVYCDFLEEHEEGV